MVHITALPTPDRDMCLQVHTGAESWKMGIGEQTCSGGTAVGCEETARGDGREDICNWECLWRKPRMPQKMPLLTDAQGVEPTL